MVKSSQKSCEVKHAEMRIYLELINANYIIFILYKQCENLSLSFFLSFFLNIYIFKYLFMLS